MSLGTSAYFLTVPNEVSLFAAAYNCTQRLFSDHSEVFLQPGVSASRWKPLKFSERLWCRLWSSFLGNQSDRPGHVGEGHQENGGKACSARVCLSRTVWYVSHRHCHSKVSKLFHTKHKSKRLALMAKKPWQIVTEKDNVGLSYNIYGVCCEDIVVIQLNFPLNFIYVAPNHNMHYLKALYLPRLTLDDVTEKPDRSHNEWALGDWREKKLPVHLNEAHTQHVFDEVLGWKRPASDVLPEKNTSWTHAQSEFLELHCSICIWSKKHLQIW